MRGVLRAPAPGTTYLHALAPVRGALWRLAVAVVGTVAGLLLLPAIAFGAVFAGARLSGFRDYSFRISDGVNAGEILSINLGLAALIPLAALLARLLYGVRVRWLVSTNPGMRWRWLLVCVGIATLGWSLFLIAGTAVAVASREEPMTAGVWAFLAVVVLTTPLHAAGEEYVFRGLLLQGLGAVRLPASVCCVASGLLFAAAHLQFDPELFADRLLLGTALAVLAIRTGGLEAGIAIHAVKNITVLLPAGLLERTASTLQPQGVSWLPLVLDGVLLAVLVPSMLRAARRRASAVVLGHPAPSAPAP